MQHQLLHFFTATPLKYFDIRLYLINSPVVRADTLKFQEKGVKDVLKDVFLPWFNAYKFLMQNIQQYEKVRVSHGWTSHFPIFAICQLVPVLFLVLRLSGCIEPGQIIYR
jgi:hypothetical protein